jgi:hypothetical protein
LEGVIRIRGRSVFAILLILTVIMLVLRTTIVLIEVQRQGVELNQTAGPAFIPNPFVATFIDQTETAKVYTTTPTPTPTATMSGELFKPFPH